MSEHRRIRCGWFFHRWTLVNFTGIAYPAIFERCSRCGRERSWRVGP